MLNSLAFRVLFVVADFFSTQWTFRYYHFEKYRSIMTIVWKPEALSHWIHSRENKCQASSIITWISSIKHQVLKNLFTWGPFCLHEVCRHWLRILPRNSTLLPSTSIHSNWTQPFFNKLFTKFSDVYRHERVSLLSQYCFLWTVELTYQSVYFCIFHHNLLWLLCNCVENL